MFLLAIAWRTAAAALPQQSAIATTLRVFVDCSRCDSAYLTTNVTFVDFVRDPAVADVQVLVTTESTAAGGLAWTAKFIGFGRFQGKDQTLTFATSTTDSDDDRRKAFARVLRLGLVPYVSDTAVMSKLDVTFSGTSETSRTTAVIDPWNYWVFSLSGYANFNGQESQHSLFHSASFSANRTTDAWKISFRGNDDGNRSEYRIDSASTVVNTGQGWSLNGRVVKSLGRHWSSGLVSSVGRSTFSNQARAYRVSPGIEFDVFPYDQSTRRILTFLYTVGASRYRYDAITIFDRISETVAEHAVNAGLSLKQPWGSLSNSTYFTQQLSQPGRYRVSNFTNADIRLFKGLSFNVQFEYERIRNQIFLAKGDVSAQDILLQIRQFATGYSYFGNVGITYSFGSIFNNIVNPRFNGQ